MAKARTPAERAKYQLHFDREKIFVVKNGKKINVYDEIQANNVDTDIYAVIEKYHGDEQAAVEQMQKDIKGMYGEFTEMDLRDLENSHIKAQNMWNSLPVSIRAQFNNNINEFVKNGEQWMKNEIEKLTPKPEQPSEPEKTKQKEGAENGK